MHFEENFFPCCELMQTTHVPRFFPGQGFLSRAEGNVLRASYTVFSKFFDRTMLPLAVGPLLDACCSPK